jgi:LEA14-like dessication related protein
MSGSSTDERDGAGDNQGSNGSESTDKTDAQGNTSPWRRRAVLAVGVLALLVTVVVAAYLLGVIGAPSAGLEDRGDWGEVRDERTEVVTTLWVANPNPFGVSLGDGFGAQYDVRFNGVALATGNRTGLDVPPGNSTLALTTTLRNERLPAWWVAFIRANETLEMDINGTVVVDVGPSVTHPIERNQTALNDSTPIITALSNAAGQTEGRYTENVSSSEVTNESLLEEPLGEGAGTVTVGYEVRRAFAEWGEVTESETAVRFHLRLHNPGDVPVPALPDGLGVTIDTNDVRLFEGDSGAISTASVGRDAVLAPGETRTVTFTVVMANERVDDWFTSHVTRDEQTDVSAQFQLVFDVPATGTELRVPENSPATYDCSLQTALLEDNQTTDTDCGETPGEN